MSHGSPRTGDAEAGGVSVVAAGAAAVVLSLAVGLVLVAGALVAAHRAQAAADLAALAGATRLQDGASARQACVVAGRTARANGASVTSCRPGVDGTVTVRVTVPVAVSPAAPDAAVAVARAGPGRSRP